MSRTAAALNRLVTALLGIVLVALAAAAIGWRREADWAMSLSRWMHSDALRDVPDDPWWPWLLLGVVVVATVVAVAVLRVDLGRRRPANLDVQLRGSAGADLELHTDLGKLASAVAAELGRYPGVGKTRGRAVVERGVTTLVLRVTASPRIDLAAFDAHAKRCAAAALSTLHAETLPVQVLLRLGPVRAEAEAADLSAPRG